MRWFIRDYHDDDLEAVVRLLDATSAHQGSVFGLSEVIAALRDDQPAVVAQRDDEVVGVVVSVVSGDRAWVARLAIAEEWRGQGMASALLLGLERVLDDQRVRVLSYVLPEEEQLADGLANAGFARRPAVAYFEKIVSVQPGQADLLTDALNANLAQVSVRQNNDMRTISAWAALIAAPTMLAGVWGMNFTHMPELGWQAGYPVAIGSMLLVVALLRRQFKRSGWL